MDWEELNGAGDELRADVGVGMVVWVQSEDRKGTSLSSFYRPNNTNLIYILQVMRHLGLIPRVAVPVLS